MTGTDKKGNAAKLLSSSFVLLVSNTLIFLCLILFFVFLEDGSPYYDNLLRVSLNKMFLGVGLSVSFVLLIWFSVMFFSKKMAIYKSQIFMLVFLLFLVPYIPFGFMSWYAHKKEFLRGVSYKEELVVRPVARDDETDVYRVNKGIIKFKNGGWVYIEANAMREDGIRDNGKYGRDFALAIDDKGMIYRLNDRIFGELEIRSESKEGIPDIYHFLQLRNWEKVK